MDHHTLSKDDILILNICRRITTYTSIASCIAACILYLKMNLSKKNLHNDVAPGTINDTDSLYILRSLKEDNDGLVKDDVKDVVKYKLTKHLAFLLIISNLCYNLSTLISLQIDIDESYHLCTLQAFLINIFDMSSVSWTAVISKAITKVKDYKSVTDIKSMILYYCLYCFIIPLVISLG